MEQKNNTNIELIRLIDKYGLTTQKIADLLFVTRDAIKSYTCDPESTRHNNMPLSKLKLLKMMIKTKGIRPKERQNA